MCIHTHRDTYNIKKNKRKFIFIITIIVKLNNFNKYSQRIKYCCLFLN